MTTPIPAVCAPLAAAVGATRQRIQQLTSAAEAEQGASAWATLSLLSQAYRTLAAQTDLLNSSIASVDAAALVAQLTVLDVRTDPGQETRLVQLWDLDTGDLAGTATTFGDVFCFPDQRPSIAGSQSPPATPMTW